MIAGLAWFAAGLAVGLGLAAVFRVFHARSSAQLQSDFQKFSLDALSRVSDQVIKLSSEMGAKQLDSKKELIDQELRQMNTQLGKVSDLMNSLEKDREAKFGQLTNQLGHLSETTSKLGEVLGSSKSRGDLGEMMAEDVLRHAGFQEHLNYVKQKMISGVGSKPDFTFLLPKNLRLNMDVKFPFDNYGKFVQSDSPADKEKFRSAFFKDVKDKIKEVTSRDYINPEQNTLNCVILLIAIEPVYAFIYQEDRSILSLAAKERVILCSPVTLLAVLAVIRQTVDNFNLGQTSSEILDLLASFKSQWHKFLEKLETVGKRIDDAQKEYQDLTTTRKKQLEKPLSKIESLQKGLPASSTGEVLDIPGQSNGA